ncbi:TPA: hypothetical protein ACJTPC_000761 [Providencia alcalifaciens]
MDNRLFSSLASLQYQFDIQDANFDVDILKFEGVEALSTPLSWRIEFTSKQDNVLPEQVLLKFATFSMRADKRVSGGIMQGVTVHTLKAPMGNETRIRLEREQK